jgi:hypothetical protein
MKGKTQKYKLLLCLKKASEKGSKFKGFIRKKNVHYFSQKMISSCIIFYYKIKCLKNFTIKYFKNSIEKKN